MAGNPTLNEKTFRELPAVESGETMTLQGTINKVAVMLTMVVTAALISWNIFIGYGDSWWTVFHLMKGPVN